MKKLIFILLAFLAVFTYIRAIGINEGGESQHEEIPHVLMETVQ